MRCFFLFFVILLSVQISCADSLRNDAFIKEFIENVISNSPVAKQELDKQKDLVSQYNVAKRFYLEWADARIDDLLKTNAILKSQLEAMPLLLHSIERLWSEEHAQRKSGPLSLIELVNATDTLAELKLRISDPDDPLIDIDNYKRLLLIPSYSGQIYQWVERLFFRRQIRKAQDCFSFFLLDENSDDFTRGAATFFIARALYNSPPDPSDSMEAYKEALPKFLITQRYATCLTYISYAYIWAAKIYAYMGYYKQALALAMIDVPSVDLATMKKLRHQEARTWAANLGNFTNSIKHLQEWARYDKDLDLTEYRKNIDEELWNYCATNSLCAYDKHIAISAALNDDREDVPEYELLSEALLHSWPNVDDIPANIATNRVLNNNVFSY